MYFPLRSFPHSGQGRLPGFEVVNLKVVAAFCAVGFGVDDEDVCSLPKLESVFAGSFCSAFTITLPLSVLNFNDEDVCSLPKLESVSAGSFCSAFTFTRPFNFSWPLSAGGFAS